MARFLATLLTLLFALPASASDRAALIVIDPGHGGEKEGAVGPGGLREKDIALSVSRLLAEELRKRGHRVLLTRERDLSLGLLPRVQLANQANADLFVSIHANSVAGAARARANGIETYFRSAEASDAQAAALAALENADDEEGQAAPIDPLEAILEDLARSEAHVDSSSLAIAIHQRLVEATGSRDRGVRQAPFLVLQGARMPAVLVEIGYISHPTESRRLADPAHQQRIARSIADGIVGFGRHTLAAKGRPRGEDAQER